MQGCARRRTGSRSNETRRHEPLERARDRGFTLVELLIVIVILGILALVTVFAVRGINDQAEESTCASEFRTLRTAEEAHYARFGSYGDEGELVSNGLLADESVPFVVTTGGGGASYDISPDGTGCTQTGTGGTAAPPAPPAPPGPVTMPSSSFSWHGGVSAWRYQHDVNGNNEIIVIGGLTGQNDWVSSDAATTPAARRTHFIDIASLDAGRIDSLLAAVNSNGVTMIAVYTADDTAPVAGSAANSVVDYLTGSVNALSAYPASSFTTLGAGGLDGLLASTSP